MAGGALQGIRVLDFGRHIAAPFCSALLGDLGAEVIRIEQVDGNDDRYLMPVRPMTVPVVRAVADLSDMPYSDHDVRDLNEQNIVFRGDLPPRRSPETAIEADTSAGDTGLSA